MLLPTRIVEKPWGRDALPEPFAVPEGKRIGEIWFEPPAQMSELLVKFIFTSEKLSVQVHPTDDQAEAAGFGRQGKEECWLVVDAAPDAKLGIGFDKAIDAENMRAAALDGSIEDCLKWYPVEPGDFFYIPANTVHAIGGGVTIIEIQQNSDITYRLYDYGRPRELHLDRAVEVACGSPHDAALRNRLPGSGGARLVDGPQFMVDHIVGSPGEDIRARYPGMLLVIPRKGEAEVAGERVAPGQCALARALQDVRFARGGECLIARSLS